MLLVLAEKVGWGHIVKTKGHLTVEGFYCKTFPINCKTREVLQVYIIINKPEKNVSIYSYRNVFPYIFYIFGKRTIFDQKIHQNYYCEAY